MIDALTLPTAAYLARFPVLTGATLYVLLAALGLALAWVAVGLRLAWHVQRDAAWLDAGRFCLRLLGLVLGLGIFAGVALLLWLGVVLPGVLDKVGQVIGPLLGLTVLLTVGTQAVWLRALTRSRLPEAGAWRTVGVVGLALVVTLGALSSVGVGMWLHLPHGFELLDGTFQVATWARVVQPGVWTFGLVMMLAVGLVLTGALLVVAAFEQAGERVLRRGEQAGLRAGLWAYGLGAVLLLATVLHWLMVVAGELPLADTVVSAEDLLVFGQRLQEGVLGLGRGWLLWLSLGVLLLGYAAWQGWTLGYRRADLARGTPMLRRVRMVATATLPVLLALGLGLLWLRAQGEWLVQGLVFQAEVQRDLGTVAAWALALAGSLGWLALLWVALLQGRQRVLNSVIESVPVPPTGGR